MSEGREHMAEEVTRLHERLDKAAEASGYHLNPDREFTRDLVEGLVSNTKRFGYPVCPCRLATGDRDRDRDIICPCDYRDPDLVEYGCCYCALYVSDEVLSGEQETRSIPERRPPEGERDTSPPSKDEAVGGPKARQGSTLPVWRCRVCGYLCAREAPPNVCPVCKATSDRFERFW